MGSPSSNKRFRRGIYLLPNLFTVGALFAGFYAIVMATKGQFDNAAIAIFFAMILDGLDGRVARMTHTQSEFGAQLDSLSDLVSFGIAPSLVLYLWALAPLGKIGWLAAFVYAVCGALRLARFNSQSESVNKHYFRGLSIPMAAGLMASVVWVCTKYNLAGESVSVGVAILAVAAGLLEVSVLRYRSFKDIDMRGKVPFYVILLIALFFGLVAYNPPVVLLAIFFMYAASGPIAMVWRRLQLMRSLKRRGSKK